MRGLWSATPSRLLNALGCCVRVRVCACVPQRGSSPLLEACRLGHTAIVKWLITDMGMPVRPGQRNRDDAGV